MPVVLKKIFIFSFLIFVFKNGQSQTHNHKESVAGTISHSVSVTGMVTKPIRLTMADLKKMPIVSKSNVAITGKEGVLKYTLKSLKGVLLKDVLLNAGIDNSDFKKAGRSCIIGTATDGYQAVFSWSEIFNSPASKNTLIVFEEDGKPVKEGEFILLSINDTANGLRHVKWLKEIAVKKAG